MDDSDTVTILNVPKVNNRKPHTRVIIVRVLIFNFRHISNPIHALNLFAASPSAFIPLSEFVVKGSHCQSSPPTKASLDQLSISSMKLFAIL